MINQKKRLIVIFIVFLFIFSSINQIISSNVLADESNGSKEPRLGIIGFLLKKFGNFMTILFPVFRLMVIAVAANPPTIEISYNETVNVEIGMWNVEDGGFKVWNVEHAIFKERFLKFEAIEYPGGNDDGSWHITYNPHTVSVSKGVTLKTNVSISLISPPTGSNPIQSGILKIGILDTWAFGNVWIPPKDSPLDNFPNRFFWFFSALRMGFGRLSGTVETEFKDVEILVKVRPSHELRFEALPSTTLHPDQITSIPITLQNLGNYNDTFSFRLASENNDIEIAAPYSITLAPGETKETYLGVSAPQSVFDYGTIHEVTIEAFSIDDPDVTIEKQMVLLETRGIYISEMMGVGLIFLIVVVFLGVALLVYRRRSLLERYCVKPEKPWDIPAEIKYLKKLKEKDKKKYNEVLQMMQDEYDSALLWYTYYRESITKPKPVKKKKKVKKQKKKPIKLKKPKKEEKIEEIKPEEPEVEEERELVVDKKDEIEKRRREQALLRIKREQEKQKRKIKDPKIENEGGE